MPNVQWIDKLFVVIQFQDFFVINVCQTISMTGKNVNFFLILLSKDYVAHIMNIC